MALHALCNFLSEDLALTEFSEDLALTSTSDFHCFEHLEKGPGPRLDSMFCPGKWIVIIVIVQLRSFSVGLRCSC